ncbi:unnamed protein product [Mytilus coruscus]|uniref:EGF-like domain-containing protein n=1 Tax=Mytilus coruscus TaxID=42192 RepID=A0A6J8BNU0_MYTCO|nr:unnamed protein product [Mytilus coruscus]
MVFKFICLALLITFIPRASGVEKCNLKTESGEIKSACCADSEAKGNDCLTCLNGYTSEIGQHCIPCQNNTYGERCRNDCDCPVFEICHNVEGCVKLPTTTAISEYGDTSVKCYCSCDIIEGCVKIPTTTEMSVHETSDKTTYLRDLDISTSGKGTDRSLSVQAHLKTIRPPKTDLASAITCRQSSSSINDLDEDKLLSGKNLAILVIVNVESYTLKCPSQNSWKIRAKLMCNSTLKYFCLYNNVAGKYVEGCNGPDWDRKGSKRIFANSFTRGKCIQNRYQPFNFQTNGSMTDCIYARSHCNEGGQVVFNDGSTKDDRTCRCDYKKSYAFLRNPRHFCFCIPTEEDCSCYVKSCPVNVSLSQDYSCKKSGGKQNQTCTEITKFDKTLVGNEGENQISLGITSELTADEVNYLRMIHLLVRVACPVVRMYFDKEIQPDQLRKTLDKYRSEMVTRCRKNDTIINDFQWRLLYGPYIGQKVTSNDFDIRLMTYL